MKYLEHRRHSMRRDTVDNQSYLSQEGVNLARRVGETMNESFDLVVTSILPRAIQTPIAMGFAIDETTENLSTFGEGVYDEMKDQGLSWTSGYLALRSALKPGSRFEAFCHQHLDLYRSWLDKIDNDQFILAISHGGVVDFPLIAMFPNADYSSWGEMFSYCEGFRVAYDGEKFSDLELLRVN